MNNKYTPGPWQLDKYEQINGIMGESVVLSGFALGGGEVAKANTKLCLAAPDMLEALEAVLNACGPYDSGLPIEQVKAAIKKAKGE